MKKEKALSKLIGVEADLEVKDKLGNTPLHIAAMNGSLSMLKMLLAAGAPVDALSENGSMPLHETVSAEHSTIIELLLKEGQK